MATWKPADTKRNDGILVYRQDDLASDQVLWRPAPKEVDVIEMSGRRLFYRIRRKDTGEEMWITDGAASQYYDHPPTRA